LLALNNVAERRQQPEWVIGSFGWNLKPWLQIVADSSYNFVTVGGVKSVMYGNHWGPRNLLQGPKSMGADSICGRFGWREHAPTSLYPGLADTRHRKTFCRIRLAAGWT